MADKYSELNNSELIERLNDLEIRVSQLESGVNSYQHEQGSISELEVPESFKQISTGSFLETKVGEYGLSWLGNIVLFFGITFLIQYISRSGYPSISTVFGYFSVATIFGIAYFLKENFPRISSIISLNGYLTAFYVTLRIYFFTEPPLINNIWIVLTLLLVIVAIQLFVAFRNNSGLLIGMSILFLASIAILSTNFHISLFITVIIAVLSVIILRRFNRTGMVYLSIIVVYIVFLLEFFSNPVMGNKLQPIEYHNYGYIYLIIVASIFSIISLFEETENLLKGRIVGFIITNGFGFSLLLTLYIITFFKEDYSIYVGVIAALALIFSIFLQIRSNWKISASLYALYAFVLFSIMIHGINSFPRAYFLLAFQSLLVVSVAIWFRSKFIVIMNTLLFAILLVFYLSNAIILDGVNISFSIVALITARILNWKRDRLTIKTSLLRNVYLVIGFIMVLITLYNLIPDRYITLSWTVAAVLYFVFSFILKNVKYRYLALGTMVASIFYFFIIDLARIELVYRIVALMFLAIISIGISIYYSKRKKNMT